ncbi:MAG: hypothetical protein WB661_11325 [Candidatus Bathyarchaeia archaeon]
MEIYYLGLFDWKNKLLAHDQVVKVAGIFLGESEPKEEDDGWFKKKNVDSFDEVSVTHSRIVFKKSLPDDDIHTFGALRDKRKPLEKALASYLKKRVGERENSLTLRKIFKRPIPRPFIYFYPLIVLGRANRLYDNHFLKNSDKDWRMPVDLSTSCFFAALDDTGRSWWRFDMEKRIYMRISGNSLVMGKASNRFTHRIINMLYYAGLYKMTRIPREQVSRENFHFGLEPLLEEQGQEITNAITQRTLEEKLSTINRFVVGLAILGAILTALSVLRQWAP